MKVIAIANSKGGVGKTTTAAALGVGLQMRGHKTLLIDLDPQCNATASLGLKSSLKTAAALFRAGYDAKDAIAHCKQCDVVPGNENMTLQGFLSEDKPYALKQSLSKLDADAYGFVVIDCPPAMGAATINALTAADSVIIPAPPEPFSLQAFGQVMRTIKMVQRSTNKTLMIDGLLITRYKTITVLARSCADKLTQFAADFGVRTFNSRIRDSVVIAESQARHLDLFSYAPNSLGAADYSRFVDEYLEVSNG